MVNQTQNSIGLFFFPPASGALDLIPWLGWPTLDFECYKCTTEETLPAACERREMDPIRTGMLGSVCHESRLTTASRFQLSFVAQSKGHAWQALPLQTSATQRLMFVRPLNGMRKFHVTQSLSRQPSQNTGHLSRSNEDQQRNGDVLHPVDTNQERKRHFSPGYILILGRRTRFTDFKILENVAILHRGSVRSSLN